ncbi:MAG: hypothetical protein ACPGWR_28120 [Ardenticatenaceae bacterium]
MRKGIICFVFFWVVAILWSASVEAQGQEITMQAHALYEGTSKYGEWLPVVVELENSGADVRGRVQISGNASSYAHHLELPRGARKQVTLFTLPNNVSRRLTVEFVAENSEEALVSEQVKIQPVRNIRFMAAAITAGGKGLEALGGINFRGERQNDRATLVPLTLETLPERPEALRTLDLIVLSGVDTSVLTERQRGALEQFVALGGMLVLGGGPEANRVLAGIPESLRPVSLTGEVGLDSLTSLDQFTGDAVKVNGPFPAAKSELLANSTLRLAQESLPILVEREVGRGIVYWLALDPSLTPFDAWSGTEAFWLGLVGSRAFYPAELPPDLAPRQLTNNDLFYALQNLPALDLPSLRILVPLLLLYIVMVGPVNYFILRRQRRLELAWATIPVITLLFSVAAYGIGYQLRGSDLILNQISLVQGIPNSEQAYVRSMIGLFSPSRRTYDLSLDSDPLLSPIQQSFDSFGNNSSSQVGHFVQGQPALVEEVTINQWSMQSFMAESIANQGYSFESDIRAEDEHLVGTITNRSDYRWENVVVALGGDFTELGDIAPGGSAEMRLKSDQNNNQIHHDIAWRLFEDQWDSPDGNRETEIRRQILASLYNSDFGSANSAQVSRHAPVLLAWIDEPPTQVTVLPASRRQPNQLATTLLYAEMPFTFTQGKITLTRGIIKSRVIENDGSYCYNPSVASVTPDFREAKIQFDLPANTAQIDPSLLTIYVDTDSGGFVSPKLSLYDYQNEQWVELKNTVLGRNKIEEPDNYLNPNGFFLMRVENENRNVGDCLIFNAALEGSL